MAKQPIKKKDPSELGGKFSALSKYKEKNNLVEVKQKPQEWLVLSEPFQKALEISGLPLGECSCVLGHSNTGKSTLILDAIRACQKQGIVPVIFDLENGIKWKHAKDVGVTVSETVDEETGEIIYGPSDDMIFYDTAALYEQFKCYNHEDGKYESKPKRGNYCIEDVALCIRELLTLQREEDWDFDLFFIIDSIGVGESYMSAVKGKTNNMWYAGAFTTAFNIIGTDLIPSSKNVNSKWTNSMFFVNKVSVETTFSGIKVAKAKGSSYSGDYLRRFAIFLGNQGSGGAKADGITYNGDFYECLRTVNISLIKNHVNEIIRDGKIVSTRKGFISPEDIPAYKDEFKKYLKERLSKKLNTNVDENDFEDTEREVNDN